MFWTQCRGGFCEQLQDEHEEERPKKRLPLDKVVEELSRQLAVQAPVHKSADRSWAVFQARTKIAYVLVRRQGYGLGEVARYFTRDAATIGTLIGGLSTRLGEDESLRREIEKLTKKVEM